MSLKVKKASHADAENPTSLAAEIACGSSSPARRAAFSRYLTASLLYSLTDDAASFDVLGNAAEDPENGEVIRKQ
jgi:hypothetical protein